MVFRHHVVAAFGVSPEAFACFLQTPGRGLGPWRVSASTSVSGRDQAVLDWQLALLSRQTGALVLRVSTVDARYAVVAVQRDGRYVALFDHPCGGLERDHPAPGSQSPDAPVPPDRLAELLVRDDEILARLHAGETPRRAWESVIRDRAESLAAELSAAGVEGVDPRRLQEALSGGGASVESDDVWADLPRLLAAMGLAGIESALTGSGGLGAGPDELGDRDAEGGGYGGAGDDRAGDDDQPPAGEDGLDGQDENEASMSRWSRGGRLGCVLLALVTVAGAVTGGWLARSYGSAMAIVGGGALGLLAPVALLGAAVAAWMALGALRLAWQASKRRGGAAPVDRAQWTRRLPPGSAAPARRALAAWSELRDELEGSPDRPADLAALSYGDVFLPRGRGSRELLERLERPGGVEALGPALAGLRLELLDRRLAKRPVDDLASRFRGLVAAPG
jgi:hypothetical protein